MILQMLAGEMPHAVVPESYIIFYNMGINKRQRHATLSFLKIDMRHGHAPSRAPIY